MSFTTDVKNELCGCEQEKIFLYGFAYCLKQKEYFTESTAVKDIIKRISGGEITVRPHKRRGRSGFLLGVSDIAADESTVISTKYVDGRDENTGLFLRGAFISCGVVSDPNKEYHLEGATKCIAISFGIFRGKRGKKQKPLPPDKRKRYESKNILP